MVKTKPRRLKIVIEGDTSHGAVARDVDTDERHELCYNCGFPRDEHKPRCPKKSTTTFVEDDDEKPVRLTDRQCHIFLRDAREFGYPSLTFAEVRAVADKIADGGDVSRDVIGVMMKNQIDEAARLIKSRK